ncbi:MAG: hypothetical protein A2231_02475 [Candidatus Firestonebacteria bacterium RIFOXYA2_FULL_40_8]|nr:MAG: hypothetical protein A2231_02475 [Candidatus Firestonebacteria bacterium RIFOXYA2_FULL_40_8]
MKSEIHFDKVYKAWLSDIKIRVRNAQIKATLKVNTELLELYWSMGKDIVLKQKETKWGEGLLIHLSKDLASEFPAMQGFSLRNLKYIRQWYLFYTKNSPIGQQVVAQLTQIPWGHNIAIMSKCKNINEALFYIQNTLSNSWSRNVLVHQIENGLYKRKGRSINNFASVLPKSNSDLAEQALKDPFIFDFLNMSKEHDENELENALVNHVMKFLLELGTGFAFLGRQVPVQVGEREFFIDLLFYHTRLHCYVVLELKTGDFEPEHAGKLNFYLKAVDNRLRSEGDLPTIGLLLCKNRDKMVAEYALSDIRKPIGISQYILSHSLPKKLKSSFPTIKELEVGLSKTPQKKLKK